MMLHPGDLITVVAEKPAAGGEMLARHEGEVVLVGGTIPGESIRARVLRVARGVAHASITEILEPHSDRRPVSGDVACGGSVYSHIKYARQLDLKSEVIRDGFSRLAHLTWNGHIDVEPSLEKGYRMRARLHVQDGRLGFLREGTHELCDAGRTGQLLDSTSAAIVELGEALRAAGHSGAASIELAENIPGDERAAHMELAEGARLPAPRLLRRVQGFSGLAWTRTEDPAVRLVTGQPFVRDTLELPGGIAGPASAVDGEPHAPGRCGIRVGLRRHVRAFFQGNRYLLLTLVNAVLAACPEGPAIDLFAGVGLFSVCLAATGDRRVVAVEGHATTADDLVANAAPFGDALVVRHASVERFLAAAAGTTARTLLLDPPRTGMTKDACAGAIAIGAERVVFVSCDVATLSRDVARFVSGGYRLVSLRGFDLFPNTAHVEVLAVLHRG